MKGTWKQELGGWNHKDSRRKKQTRKNFLRDNGRYYTMHAEECNSCRTEGEVEVGTIDTFKHGETKNIYKIRINKYMDNYSLRTAYFTGLLHYDPRWYDAFTHEYIDMWGRGKFEILGIAWTEYTHYDEPKIVNRGYRYSGRGWYKETLFVAGLPYYDWDRWNQCKDFNTKWATKSVNRANRAKVRTYLEHGDWDAEIKQHPCTKTVAWMVN